MTATLFILYVSDQRRSAEFYRRILNLEPTLDVPGMTEFRLSDHSQLGLMPNSGIAKIICPSMPDPALADGVPRCELYWRVDRPDEMIRRALEAGAGLISPIQARNWGESVAYLSDPDGHILAIAQKN